MKKSIIADCPGGKTVTESVEILFDSCLKSLKIFKLFFFSVTLNKQEFLLYEVQQLS